MSKNKKILAGDDEVSIVIDNINDLDAIKKVVSASVDVGQSAVLSIKGDFDQLRQLAEMLETLGVEGVSSALRVRGTPKS